MTLSLFLSLLVGNLVGQIIYGTYIRPLLFGTKESN